MRCRICKKEATVFLRSFHLALCSDDFLARFLRRTEEAIKKYRMFARDEKILVAVSGGKDSLALLTLLKESGRNVTGLYINLGVEEGGYSDKSEEFTRNVCTEKDIPLTVINVKKETGRPAPFFERNRSYCSSCGIVKRYFMNKTARDGGFDAVATGHNLDDETSVLLSNNLRWETGYLERQNPVLERGEGLIRKVKPFAFFTEKEDLAFCLIRKIRFITDECPYAKGATSIFYKDVFNRIEEQMPGTKLQYYRQFLDFQKTHLVRQTPLVLNACRVCGQGTVLDVCNFCRILEKTRRREAEMKG
ncbi:MAG TPA: ATP-binding protein [bacterium]|nr:ATP-binding protein [bacterium]